MTHSSKTYEDPGNQTTARRDEVRYYIGAPNEEVVTAAKKPFLAPVSLTFLANWHG